ncbi:monocarboxylate transporter 4-like [Orbicella faveolata]|uniref:monocarboxylate transporter 4-like n=1 Tax=Orbicella faveolata TaxID=48498 RepID=UPI0009E3A7F2|nr:monocarboxylate transporter 4-like [Orbicella faveolata]
MSVNPEEADSTEIIVNQDGLQQFQARRKSCDPDSCWSWLVCVVCAFCNIIICGLTYSYGILFPWLLDEFQQGKAKTALVGSLAMVGTGVYGMLVAKVFNRIGPLKTAIVGTLISIVALLVTSRGTSIYFIMISYGIVFGIGSCFVFLPLYLVIPRYFIKRRSLALGLVATGPGGGLFVMSPVVQALVDALDWRGAFMAMAGIVALIGPLVCVFRRMPGDIGTEQNSAEDEIKGKLCDFSVFRNKRFVIFTLAVCLMYTGHYIPSVHMVRYCETIGIPPTQSSKLYVYSGVTSLLIRPVIGRLCDVKWIQAHFLFQIAAAFEGIASLLLPLARRNLYLVFYFILYGCTDGAMGSAMCVAVMFCFQGTKRVRGFGLFQSITNIVSAFGPALGGLVADSFGSYPPAFYMAGIFVSLSAAVVFLFLFVKEDQEDNDHATMTEALMIVEKCTVV